MLIFEGYLEVDFGVGYLYDVESPYYLLYIYTYFKPDIHDLFFRVEPATGFEPVTFSLQMRGSTN